MKRAWVIAVAYLCIHLQTRFDMRAAKTLGLFLAAGLALGMGTGCHSASNGSTTQGSTGDSKMNGGNGQNSGNNATGSGNGATRNAQTQGGGSGAQLTEPATSTTGAASGPSAAASDSGSPAAVAHQSVAMPGAPEPTVKDKPQQKPQQSQAAPQ